LAGTAAPNRAADDAEQTDDVVVVRIEVFVRRPEDAGHETEHELRANAATRERREERNRRPQGTVAGEEVAGAAEPGEKRRGGREIEGRGRAGQVPAMSDVSRVAGVR